MEHTKELVARYDALAESNRQSATAAEKEGKRELAAYRIGKAHAYETIAFELEHGTTIGG